MSRKEHFDKGKKWYGEHETCATCGGYANPALQELGEYELTCETCKADFENDWYYE
jgi:hypothetical protein